LAVRELLVGLRIVPREWSSLMWLPRDERRLLAGYYALIGAVGTERVFRVCDLARLLRFRGLRCSVPEYGESKHSRDHSGDFESVKREIEQDIDARIRIKKGNALLTARGLITCRPQEHEIDVVAIGLSVSGYDLGRRYSHWFSSTGLLFQEYRNHWIWLIVAFFGGAFGSRLLEWVGSLVTES
jgi:hypothetical protein